MRVVIATLDGVEPLHALARAWHAAALPPERLHVIGGQGARRVPGLPIVPVAVHGGCSLWMLAESGARGLAPDASAPVRQRRQRRQHRRRGLLLLARLILAAERSGWASHAEALARGQRLGVARLGRGGEDQTALVRPLLAVASGSVQVRDLSLEPRGRPGSA